MPLPSHEAMESPKEPMQWLQGRTKLMHPFSSHGGHALSMSKQPGSILPMRSVEDEIPVDEELAISSGFSCHLYSLQMSGLPVLQSFVSKRLMEHFKFFFAVPSESIRCTQSGTHSSPIPQM